jgi:hypothetical protein
MECPLELTLIHRDRNRLRNDRSRNDTRCPAEPAQALDLFPENRSTFAVHYWVLSHGRQLRLFTFPPCTMYTSLLAYTKPQPSPNQ